MALYIGTSGYYYPDWKGIFYPKGTKDYLDFYKNYFKCVEINSTYYRELDYRYFSKLVKKTDPDFKFAVKAFANLTHDIGMYKQSAKDFRAAVKPLVDSEQLASVLAQFPHSFRCDRSNKDYIERLQEALGDLPLAVEFRHISWQSNETNNWLIKRKLSLCAVDAPDLPSLPNRTCQATSDVGYVRFHSRDRSKWWGQGGKDRYNYLYSKKELEEWLPKIRDLVTKTSTTLVFFNNCHFGQAVRNAQDLQVLLGQGAIPFDLGL